MAIVHLCKYYTMTVITRTETGLGSVHQAVNNGYLSRWEADLANFILFLGLICNFFSYCEHVLSKK